MRCAHNHPPRSYACQHLSWQEKEELSAGLPLTMGAGYTGRGMPMAGCWPTCSSVACTKGVDSSTAWDCEPAGCGCCEGSVWPA